MKRVTFKRIFLALCFLGFLLPQRLVMPVKGATTHDWNHRSFWYEPWGKSGVHKGIDIFAKKGTTLLASTDGIVIFKGKLALGGNVIALLGAKWRVHYYAHLKSSSASLGQFVTASEPIGLVGDSGNAKGKQPHLHYSILTLFPYVWRADGSTQGWKKMFYLNPSTLLLGSN